MLTIRLQRAGRKNKPLYRVVLAQKTAAAQKKFVEVIGSYNPHSKELAIRDEARLNYWVQEQHVDMSPTVQNLLVTKGLLKTAKVKAFTLPKKETPAEEAPAASAETATPVVEEATVEETAPAETAPTEEAVSETTTPEEPAAE